MDTTLEDTSSPTGRLCKHPNCQKPLIKNEGESQSRYEVRKYCNAACFKTDPDLRKAQRDTFTAIRESECKNCEICKKSFHRNKNEARAIFNDRPTCSRPCAAKKRSLEFEAEILNHPKTCTNTDCGKTFYRRLKTETKEKFNQRETCSISCNNAKRRQNSKHDWEKKTRRSSFSTKKEETISTLPPSEPLAREIPDAPTVDTVVVWRPESWGGSYMRRVS